jgi:hypothetical protein
LPVDGRGVTDDVQVVMVEIDDARTGVVGEEGVANGPLSGNGPVKDWRSGWHLVDLDGNVLLKDAKGFSHSGASDAATDWEQTGGQVVHPLPGVGRFAGYAGEID